jgi:hypothetical protein
LIHLTDRAKDYITENGIREIYLVLKYVRGPCDSNLCRMIPTIQITSSVPDGTRVVLLDSEFVKIYAVPPVANVIRKTRKQPEIGLTRIGKRLKIDGVPYTF